MIYPHRRFNGRTPQLAPTSKLMEAIYETYEPKLYAGQPDWLRSIGWVEEASVIDRSLREQSQQD